MKLIKIKIPWKSLKGRRKGFFSLMLIGIAIVLAYQFTIVPIMESERKVKEDLVLKKKILSRYQEYIRTGKDIEEELNQTFQRVEAIQSRLLPGEKPQINAANLQEILKKLSEKNGIQIRSFRIGEPKEMNFYLKIPVIIDINPTKSVASLTYFLYDIENNEKLLQVSDLDITAPNMRAPTEVQASLTVAGFTKNTNPKGKAKEG